MGRSARSVAQHHEFDSLVDAALGKRSNMTSLRRSAPALACLSSNSISATSWGHLARVQAGLAVRIDLTEQPE
jgi:hypothetical protein